MKKSVSYGLIVAVLLGVAFTGSVALAKYRGDKGERMDRRVERLSSELSLSADQETKIRSIFEEQKEKMKALREETRKKVASVLTADQKTKFEGLREKHREKSKDKYDR